MSRYIFSKNNRWYISEVFDPSDSKLQEKATYYTLTDDVTGPYYAVGTSDSASIGVSYVPVVEPAGADVTLGVVDSQGRFQALRFNGTWASNSGSAFEVQNYKTWNSTLPAPTPSGGAMDFYKCSYVNSDSWGGRKAVLDNGIYSFQSNSTVGLIYGDVKPVIGSAYSNGTLIQAILYQGWQAPTAGLVFYASLASSDSKAQTGQVFSGLSNVAQYTVKYGIPCAKFTTAQYLTASDTGLPSGDQPSTLCGWICYDVLPDTWSGGLAYGTGSTNLSRTGIGTDDSNKFNTGAWGVNCTGTTVAATGTWYFILSTYQGGYLQGKEGVIKTYVNGRLQNTLYDNNLQITLNGINIGPGASCQAFLAGLRVYNRVLTDAEIAVLAAEFTPTQA